MGGVTAAIFGTGAPRFSGPKYFSTSFLACGWIEIADDREAGVIRRVVELEEIAHVLEFRRLDVGVRPHHVRVIGMALGEQFVEHAFLDDAVRAVLDALAALVAHHVLLVGQAGLIQLVGQIAHAVRFEPQSEFQLVRRNRLEIIGAVKIGGAVDVGGPRRFQVPEMIVAGNVFGALEHHVLEQVRESRAAREFIRRAHVIPDVR